MEITVEHFGSVQFEIKTRGHSIISDQPRKNGGFDEGVTPPELLLASLGSCAGYYAAPYLRKHKLAAQGESASAATHEKAFTKRSSIASSITRCGTRRQSP